MGGGLPCGAIGGTEEVMAVVVSGEYEQVGTFNGNPMTMAAARAALTEVLVVPDAYERFDQLRAIMVGGAEAILQEFALPAYVEAMGAKGCITFSPTRVHNYREFVPIDDRWSHALWLYQQNNGVFLPPWGKAEQWMLSVQHSDEDAHRFVENVRTFAKALRR
jgi:glutamate-1-semialdehyde 2,1-aminomutase